MKEEGNNKRYKSFVEFLTSHLYSKLLHDDNASGRLGYDFTSIIIIIIIIISYTV